MHNDIMVADFKEHPPMLASDSYAKWNQAKAVHMILNEIENDIYSTIDAFPNAKEMWIAIEHLYRESPSTFRMSGQSCFANLNLDNVSYHTLIDILKQHQNKVNKIHAERMATNVNPLALVVVAQHYPDYYTQAPKPYKTHAQSTRQTPSTRYHTTTRNKGKGIVKPLSPPSEDESEKEQSQRDK
ncbi:hypothetical protein Tco_1250248 [Tanacetum coccineum]